MNKYLVYVPDLVSIEFDSESELVNFFKTHFELFGTTSKKLKYHFVIKSFSDQEIFTNTYKQTIFQTYNAGITKQKIFWYSRHLGLFKIDLTYYINKKSFYINESLSYKFIFSKLKIGEFFSSKDIIKELINIILFLDGYIIFPGFCIRTAKRRVFLCAVPRGNGKSSYIIKKLKAASPKYSYISDNNVIIDLDSKQCFPTVPVWSLNKDNSKEIYTNLKTNKIKIVRESVPFKKIYFLINKFNKNFPPLSLEDFITGFGSEGYVHLLIRDYLMLSLSGNSFLKANDEIISRFKEMQKKGQLILRMIHHYNFDEFLDEEI